MIEIFGYNQKNIEALKDHDVLFSLINKNNKLVIWIFFPIIIITEELMFRYYSIGFLFSSLKLGFIDVILISSLIFSLYHIHIWFRYKNLEIFLIFLGSSLLLGLYNGYLFLKVGLIPCILVHYIVAFYSYYSIYKRYYRPSDSKID
ncbi:MAG: CPBP family glutamic-type intramembrane protease [Promethearchaeota archaeon]